MKLNVITLVCTFNHHISMARAIVDVLEAHGISIDQGRGPSHIGMGDLFSEREDAEVESHLAMLREAAGIDEPEPVGITEARTSSKPSTRFTPPGHALADKPAPKAKAKTRKKRNLSPEARQRIADAQKKRWEAHRKDAAGFKAEAAPVQ